MLRTITVENTAPQADEGNCTYGKSSGERFLSLHEALVAKSKFNIHLWLIHKIRSDT